MLAALTTVLVGLSIVLAAQQAWRALPASGMVSLLDRGTLTILIALLPTIMVWWAFSPRADRPRPGWWLALGVGGLALAGDFAAWVTYASAQSLPSPWVAPAMFTFIHACGPLALILPLQTWATPAEEHP
ncbi:hypothetical protein ACH47V_26410 [Micromonospora chersina]|uniref:hypothetical protein n=1 Tax=Micromonospora chersina TaxID=47854 RepID=UPI0033C26635